MLRAIQATPISLELRGTPRMLAGAHHAPLAVSVRLDTESTVPDGTEPLTPISRSPPKVMVAPDATPVEVTFWLSVTVVLVTSSAYVPAGIFVPVTVCPATVGEVAVKVSTFPLAVAADVASVEVG